VKAAELRTLGQAIRNGTMTPDQLEAIAPGLGNAAVNDPDKDFTPDPNATPAAPSIYPESIQKEALAQYAAINKPGTNATPQQIAATNAMLAAVLPSVARATGVDKQADPNTVGQLQSIAMMMKGPQSIIQQAAFNPALMQAPTTMFGTPTGDPSPYDQAVQKLNTLQQQQQAILHGAGQQAAPDQAQPAPSTFGNRFLNPQGTDLGQGMSLPQVDTGTTLTSDALSGVKPPPITIPGNPATTAAVNATAKPPTKKAMIQPSPEDVAYLAQNRSPVTVQMFEARFGPGSAMKALQSYNATTSNAPALPAR
jgi:hypothetical protein